MGPTKDAALVEEERRGQELAPFLKKHHPALTEAELIGLLEPKYGQYWSQKDEKRLDKRRTTSSEHIAILEADFTKTNTAAVLLWRAFPRLYRKLPTDLFSLANKIEFDTSATFGADNIMWSKGFCDELAAFSINPFWMWDAKVDFPLMAQLIQLVVRCRTNDCRPWNTGNITSDTFIEVMVEQLEDESKSGRTMKEIMDDTVAAFRREFPGKRRPSEMQSLFCAIVAKAFNPDKPKITGDHAGKGENYSVMAKDIQLLNGVLAEFGPNESRAGLEERIHGSIWKRVMTHTRSKKTQSVALPHKTEDIAKVISLSLIARQREYIVADRKAKGRKRAAGSRLPTGGVVWGDGRPFAPEVDEDEDESEEDTLARQKRKKRGAAVKVGKAGKAAEKGKGRAKPKPKPKAKATSTVVNKSRTTVGAETFDESSSESEEETEEEEEETEEEEEDEESDRQFAARDSEQPSARSETFHPDIDDGDDGMIAYGSDHEPNDEGPGHSRASVELGEEDGGVADTASVQREDESHVIEGSLKEVPQPEDLGEGRSLTSIPVKPEVESTEAVAGRARAETDSSDEELLPPPGKKRRILN